MFRSNVYKCLMFAIAPLWLAACQDQVSMSEISNKDSRPKTVETQVKPSPFYDETWYEAGFWPGEYPNGLIVLEPGVTLPARTANNPNVNHSLECKMDFLGVYHPHPYECKQWVERPK